MAVDPAETFRLVPAAACGRLHGRVAGLRQLRGGSLANVEYDLANLWARDQSGFAVVTSQEVASGVVKLSQYKAVLPLNGVDAALKAYAAAAVSANEVAARDVRSRLRSAVQSVLAADGARRRGRPPQRIHHAGRE